MTRPSSRPGSSRPATLRRAPAPEKTRPAPTTPAQPDAAGERLSKRVARMVPCSRREAEQYIEDGWVRVDGVCVEQPQARVTEQSRVELDANATRIAPLPVTLIWHKPAGHAANASALKPDNHMPRDHTPIEVLRRHFNGLENHVPLEDAASGLVAWTQDWRVARKLSETLGELEHELMIDVRGSVDEAQLQQLQRAFSDPRQNLPPAKISISSNRPESSRLRLAVKGSHPGLAAYLCDLVQLQILGLHRVRLGRVGLGDVTPGQWRYMAPYERF